MTNAWSSRTKSWFPLATETLPVPRARSATVRWKKWTRGSVNNARKPSPKDSCYRCMCVPANQTDRTSAAIARCHLPTRLIWGPTWCPISTRNHLSAGSAHAHLPAPLRWTITSVRTLGRNRLTVSSVGGCSARQVCWRDTKEPQGNVSLPDLLATATVNKPSDPWSCI